MPTPRSLLLLALSALAVAPASASAVVGGQDASQPYPHMAAMSDTTGEWAGCGGSLVRADWVMTAAHCVTDGDNEAVDPKGLSWLVGTHSLAEPTGEEIPAAEVIVHERWGDEDNADSSSFDVALVRLARPATKGTPIRIATPAEKGLWADGKQATVIGWGSQDPVGLLLYPDDLQELDVPMVADSECETFYPGLPAVGKFESQTMVCAGYTEGTKDSCFGDSGGPLMVPDTTGALVQVGVVSWGNQCALPTQYGVYSRVADATLYDWIQSKLPAATTSSTGTSTTTGKSTTPATRSGSTAATSPAASTGLSTSSSTPVAKRPAATTKAKRRAAAKRRCLTKARSLKGAKRSRAMKRCAKAAKPKKTKRAGKARKAKRRG